MLKRWLGIGAGALAALTAACDGAPTTQQVYIKDQGVLSYLQYAAVQGPMLVVVHGNPFVTSKPFLDEVVAAELEASVTYLKGVHFTTDPALAFKPEYRIILVLGGTATVDGNRLCAGDPPALDEKADPIRMTAVFCHRDDMFSWVSGSIGARSTPEDDRFRSWIRLIGRDLLNPG